MNLHTKKQLQYFEEVIRLHCKYGYGEKRISRILPIGHATVSRWIRIFVSEKGKKSVQMPKSKLKSDTPSRLAAGQLHEGKDLQAEIIRLQSELKGERLRAEAYEEMINVAESKFKISIRKKAGAKR